MIPNVQSVQLPMREGMQPPKPVEKCHGASAELLEFLKVVGIALAEKWHAESSRGTNPSNDKTKPR